MGGYSLRVFVTFIILLVNLVLQSTLFNYIQLFHIKPNTAVVIIVSYALLRGEIEGAMVGFFAGLMQDIFFGTSLGFFALTGLLLGFFCGKFFKNFYRENIFLPLVLCVLGVFFSSCIFYVFYFLLRGRLDFLYYFKHIILIEAAYTGAISLLLYNLLYFINLKLENTERDRRKFY